MNTEKCDTCGPHLDRIRDELLSYRPLDAAMVERVLATVAPHLHDAVTEAPACDSEYCVVHGTKRA